MIAGDIEKLSDLQDSVLRRAASIHRLTEVEQFNLNRQWTDYLQTLIDYGNTYLLKCFRYRLIMEDV